MAQLRATSPTSLVFFYQMPSAHLALYVGDFGLAGLSFGVVESVCALWVVVALLSDLEGPVVRYYYPFSITKKDNIEI